MDQHTLTSQILSLSPEEVLTLFGLDRESLAEHYREGWLLWLREQPRKNWSCWQECWRDYYPIAVRALIEEQVIGFAFTEEFPHQMRVFCDLGFYPATAAWVVLHEAGFLVPGRNSL